MANTNYGFIRSTNTWGPNSIPWQDMVAAGLMPLLASDDPNLDAAMAAAQQAGVQAGIWVPAGNEGLPEQYAAQLVDLYKKYGPAALVPNIEYVGKGGQGSMGYDWNQRMVNELVRLGMPPNLAVAVLGEDDFNYKAYTDQGIKILPETFGSNTARDLEDVQAQHDRLIQLGVPENLISMLLAPAQSGTTRGSVFTIDDLKPEELKALAQAGINPADAVQAVNEQSPAPVQERVKDADNPAAVRYAQTRLAALARQGITPDQYGLENLDPTAQWRALSSIVGANQAIQSGHAADYHLSPNAPASVASYVNKLLAAAMQPEDPSTFSPEPGPVQSPESDVVTHPLGLGFPRPGVPTTPNMPPRPGVPTHPVAPPRPGVPTHPVLPPKTGDVPEHPTLVPPSLVPTRNPAGVLAPVEKRIGPMQQAIMNAAAVKALRGPLPGTLSGRRAE